jgi:hypothetical protein
LTFGIKSLQALAQNGVVQIGNRFRVTRLEFGAVADEVEHLDGAMEALMRQTRNPHRRGRIGERLLEPDDKGRSVAGIEPKGRGIRGRLVQQHRPHRFVHLQSLLEKRLATREVVIDQEE